MIREMEGNFEKVAYTESNPILLYLNTQNANFDTHWHTAAEIIMPIDNGYYVSINDREFNLKEKDILFIPPGELHTLKAPPTGKRLILMFDLGFFNTLVDFSSLTPILSQPFLISDSSYGEIHDLEVEFLQQIIEEYPNQSLTLRMSMMYSYLLQFFVYLGRQHIKTEVIFPDVRSGKQLEYVEKLNNVITYINANYADEITLEKASSIAGFSKFHFTRLFKQFTGQSFYSYLNQRRIKAAEAFLLSPNLSITEVAMRSGFTSIATFNRVFRQFKDCTPSEYKVYYHITQRRR